MEVFLVKHIVRLSKKRPVAADAIQEFICSKSKFLYDTLALKGGSIPLLTWIVEECDIPEPEA